MNLIKAIGLKAKKLADKLAVERDAGDGDVRVLHDGDVQLDGVKAWERKDPKVAIKHDIKGSMVEIVYEAYRKPTERQKLEASDAIQSGIERRLIRGKIVDIKTLDNGDTYLLVTTGFRKSTKKATQGQGTPMLRASPSWWTYGSPW